MKVLEQQPRAACEIASAPDRARRARLREWTAELARPRHFEEQPRENARVRRFIADLLERLGYTVEIQGRFQNVVALPPDRRNLTLVGAHYDSVPQSAGADDNASGVAVLLEAATTLARAGTPNVGFVAFNAEEDGLLGSADFVANGLATLDARVAGVHVLEMVGFASNEPGSQEVPRWLPGRAPDRGDFLGLLANGRSHALIERTFERAARATPDLGLLGLTTDLGLERLLPVLLLSDHAPFWKAGIPAVMWTDTSFFRNPNYHGATDTPETLDYPFMERVAALLIASVAA